LECGKCDSSGLPIAPTALPTKEHREEQDIQPIRNKEKVTEILIGQRAVVGEQSKLEDG
jgi:hypothetical protein